jgi:dephospho-CoA kinase
VRLVGLTGGIGSGKSTVARMLADRGAAVIDADEIARQVVEPDREAFDEIVERFGDSVVGPDGVLDRGRLAETVFADQSAREDLNAIVHPRVREEIGRRLEALAAEGSDRLVVLDIPLLAEGGQTEGYEAIIVVTAPVETRVDRLVRDRDMDPDDVRARIAAQASDDDRRAIATHVVDNSGSPEDLQRQVDEVYDEIAVAGQR